MANTFGARFRQCRKAAGFTQQTAAQRLRVSVGTVAYIETGRAPELDTAVRAAALFGQSLDWFVLGVGRMRGLRVQSKRATPRRGEALAQKAAS